MLCECMSWVLRWDKLLSVFTENTAGSPKLLPRCPQSQCQWVAFAWTRVCVNNRTWDRNTIPFYRICTLHRFIFTKALGTHPISKKRNPSYSEGLSDFLRIPTSKWTWNQESDTKYPIHSREPWNTFNDSTISHMVVFNASSRDKVNRSQCYWGYWSLVCFPVWSQRKRTFLSSRWAIATSTLPFYSWYAFICIEFRNHQTPAG